MSTPAAPPERRKIAYRPAVDGVRGIGVTVVLLYHAGVSWLQGAFLNIDMFFVTSGFLITAVLLAEHRRYGTISLLGFWANRARRLLPALLGMVALVALYAWLWADPTTLRKLRIDMLSTLTFWSNWRFATEEQSYFAVGDQVSPLLHTWSLSIEEQFYLVWPVLLLLWLRWRKGSTRWLPTVLMVLAVASAVYMAAIYEPFSDPSSVYYNSFARAQALLIGCTLGVLVVRAAERGPKQQRGPRRVVALGPVDLTARSGIWVLGVLGFLALLGLPLLVTETSQWVFRGGFFVASLAAFAMGWHVVALPDSALTRALSWRPFVATGRRTYGLYVWHWPLFLILDSERTGLSGVPLMVLRMASVFALAFAYDTYVERPIRRGALSRLRPGAAPLITGTAFGTACLLTLTSTANAQPPVFGTGLPGSISTVTGPMRPGQDKVLVLGDSVAFTLWKYFPQQDYPDLSVGSSTQLGCGIATPQELQIGGSRTTPSPQCDGWESRWSALVDQVSPDRSVVLSGSAELFDRWVDARLVRVGTPEWTALMERTFGRAVDIAGRRGANPVSLVNIPCYGRTVASGDAAMPGVSPEQAEGAAREQNDPARQQALNTALQRVAATRPWVTMLDMRGFLCPQGSYVDRAYGVQLRTDGVHLTPDAVGLWWQRFAPTLVGRTDRTAE